MEGSGIFKIDFSVFTDQLLCQEAILAARRRRDQLRAQNEELEANIRNTVRELNTRRLGGGA